MKKSISLISFFLFIISFSLSSLEVIAQSNFHNKNTMYVSPLNLLNLNGNSFQLTYGRRLKDFGEMQFSYSHRLKKMPPGFYSEDYGVDLFNQYGARYKEGRRFGLEYQMFMKKRKSTTNYIGLELFAQNDKILFKDLGGLFEQGRTINLVRKNYGMNFKMGAKIELSEHFILDLYGGLGFKKQFFNYDKPHWVAGEENLKATKTRISMPFNIKLGYRF